MEPKKYILIFLMVMAALWASGQPDALGAITTAYEESPFAAEIYKTADFSDVKAHWARGSIYAMVAQSIMKGDGQGSFRPEGTLTQEEALALVIRIAGYEEEAQIAAEIRPQNQQADFWADGYIQIAANRGIISPAEQADLNANKNKNAQRQEVAAWLSKALDLPAIYGTNQQIIYSFSDAQQFNPQLISAIEALLQLKIMSGDSDGRFRPTATIKRGEMAAVLDRVSSQGMDKRGWGSFQGQIVGENQRWEAAGGKAGRWIDLDIQLPGLDRAEVSYKERSGFPVFKDNVLARADALKVGEHVEFTFNPKNEVAFAKVLPIKQRTFDGYLLAISNDQKSLQLQDPYSQQKRSIPISDQVAVIMDGRPAGLKDLLAGQELNLAVSNDYIVRIDATLGPAFVGYEPSGRAVTKYGRIKEVLGDFLTISGNGSEEIYRLSPSTQLLKGRQPIKISDLRVGDRVRLEVANSELGQVSRLELSSFEGLADQVVRGRLNAVYPEGRKISLTDPQEYFYGRWYPLAALGSVELDGGADIYAGNQLVSLEELRRGYLGDEVIIALGSTPGSLLGSKLVVRGGEPRPYNGLIDQVAWALNRFSLSKQGESLLVGEGTIAIRDGKLVDPQDFQVDEHVFLETVYTGGAEHSLLMQYFQGVPSGLQIYAGRLDRIERRSLELSSARELVNNEWRSLSARRVRELIFDNRTRIWDSQEGGGRGWLTSDELAESRWSDEYRRFDSFIVTDDANQVLAMTLRRSNPDVLKSSIARISQMDRDGAYLGFDRVQDWSEGYQRWTANPNSLRLRVEDSLVFIGSSLGGLGDLKLGDVVYVIHDQLEGCLIFKQ